MACLQHADELQAEDQFLELLVVRVRLHGEPARRARAHASVMPLPRSQPPPATALERACSSQVPVNRSWRRAPIRGCAGGGCGQRGGDGEEHEGPARQRRHVERREQHGQHGYAAGGGCQVSRAAAASGRQPTAERAQRAHWLRGGRIG